MPRGVPMSVEQRAAVRAAWERNEKLDVIAEQFRTSRGHICNLAKAGGWPARPRGPRRRWEGEMLSKLEAAWRTDPRTREEIAADFGTSVSRCGQLARQHDWPRGRRRGTARGKPWSWSRRAAQEMDVLP